MLGHHQINLVELDFLARGERFEMLAKLPDGNCFAFVTRADTRSHCDVFAWTYRDPLPTIPIPLRTEEQEVGLDLAAVVQQTYERGSYDRAIKYTEPPDFLSAADRQWAAELIRGTGFQPVSK